MSRIKKLPMSPAQGVFHLLVVFALLCYLWLHEDLSAGLPSLFRDGLGDTSYAYWHRWVHLMAAEMLIPILLIWIVWSLVSVSFDSVYHFAKRHPLLPMLVPVIFMAVLIGRDVYAGFAIYEDRIAMRSPLSGLAIREYGVKDIARVEVGCHERWRSGKRTPNWAVPSYKIVFRDGTIVSPFDLADSAYKDPALMKAILAFDTHVQAAGTPKTYRLNLFDYRMDGAACFDRMEGDYAAGFRPAMRKTFLSKGTAGWQPSTSY